MSHLSKKHSIKNKLFFSERPAGPVSPKQVQRAKSIYQFKIDLRGETGKYEKSSIS
jgi:hypothetical protein